MVKRLPTMQETQVQSLGWEDLLEKEMATHSSVLAWKIPQTEDPGYQSTDYGPVQFSSVAQSCPTLCNPRNCSTPGLSAHHQLPEFTQTHVHRVSDAIQPSHPLLSPSPPALPNESTLCMRWPKYWSFSFSISPLYEHLGLISFRMDWLDLLEVQGTLKSLL